MGVMYKMAVRIAAGSLLLWALWNSMFFPARGAEQPREETVDISNIEMLESWYGGLDRKNTVGVLTKNLLVSRQVKLARPEGLASGETVELRIPAGLSIKIVSRGSLTIDNPDLVIHGGSRFMVVSGQGTLTLSHGRIQADNSNQPSVILMDHAVFNYGKGFQAPNPTVRDERIDAPETDPGASGQGVEPKMTKAVLQDLDSGGNGSARLEFEHLPSDIKAIYIYRSRDGKTWTREKNRLSGASSQGGQNTVEYENFLRETGNTLNTAIVEDKYLIYRFQSAYESFYVKSRIEWTAGETETEKIKLALPEYVGQGSGISYSYGGSSQGGAFRGYYSNLGGQLTTPPHSGMEESPQEETDAPEAPVRGRGGGNRRGSNGSDAPSQPWPFVSGEQTAQADPATKSTATASTATASTATASTATASTAIASAATASTATASTASAGKGEESAAQEQVGEAEASGDNGGASEDQMAAERRETEDAEGFRAAVYILSCVGAAAFLGGAVYYIHRRRSR